MDAADLDSILWEPRIPPLGRCEFGNGLAHLGRLKIRRQATAWRDCSTSRCTVGESLAPTPDQ